MKKVASALARLVATPLLPSHYVQLVWPLAAGHTLRARVEAVRDEAPGVRTLTLRPGRGWTGHRAGQHVQIGLPIDGRIATRTFSISSAPDRRDGRIELTVKAQGQVSGALVRDVAPGAFLTLSQAAGDFVLPAVPPPRALFVTAGSGITPIASMLRGCRLPDAVHVHLCRTRADMIFGAELAARAAADPAYRLVVVETRAGRPDLAALLDAEVADWRARETWACGPQSLLAVLEAAITAAGGTLHVERFTAAFAVPVPGATGGRVRFAASNVETRADGRTPLLRIAEAAGLSPAHGCRMGICHGCDANLVSGCVRDLRTGTSIAEPGARIQICVCAAAGDVELTL